MYMYMWNKNFLHTHFMAQHPGLRWRIYLDQYGWRAHHQHQQIGNAEICKEYIGGVAHIFGFHNNNRHLNEVVERSDKQIENESE